MTEDVAPAIRCAMFLLKFAAPIGKISAGIDFPIPMESIEKLKHAYSIVLAEIEKKERLLSKR